MREAEAGAVDLRELVKQTIAAVQWETPFSVRQRWGHETPQGLAVTYAEKENRSTECPVVDFVSYQIDVWGPERSQVTALAGLVNTALLELGLKRLSRSESVTEEGLGRCSMVFGRKVDKRWGRFID